MNIRKSCIFLIFRDLLNMLKMGIFWPLGGLADRYKSYGEAFVKIFQYFVCCYLLSLW